MLRAEIVPPRGDPWRFLRAEISALQIGGAGCLPPCNDPHTSAARFFGDTVVRDGLADHSMEGALVDYVRSVAPDEVDDGHHREARACLLRRRLAEIEKRRASWS
jgi:hypothetical protein